ncbi:VCBS repeat-containing protein [Mycobacterium sp. BK086]|uniref:beta strand repeat-containing protein n=1 Tax=Mycobacterium sp. BK086 TaxID=2512165 RepID=UPI00106230E4|nr:Ig-like domain-containing protein [Mycobacterium sp. BK086]TDO17130.1 VCBS repeat-containing protein [Mycobacterium sp. BK086]
MAATSPRKRRGTTGRHRKPSAFESSNCAQWLRVGAVGVGLGAAIVGSQAIASAAPDDSQSANPGASTGHGKSDRSTSKAAAGPRSPSARVGQSESSKRKPAAPLTVSAPSAVPATATRSAAAVAAPTPYVRALNDALDSIGLGPVGGPVRLPTPPPVNVDGTRLLTELSELATRVVHRVGAGLGDEIANATRDLERSIRLSVAPIAASLHDLFAAPSGAAPSAAASATPTAAATAEAGSAAWYFMGVLTRAVDRLAGWPGLPHNFVTITNYVTDQNLDTLDNQLDALIANAIAGSPARWIPDLSSILGMFVKPSIPSYSFSDTLNAWGDFLNRIVPPFNIAPGAGTFGIITQYKIMGAAVVGTATVLTDMLNGVYDPAQWEIDVIKATTGATVTRADLTNSTSLETKIAAAQAAAILTLGLSDGGAYYDPTRAWNITLPTWTAAQVNPFTVVAYVALVAMYKRFQEVAVLTTFTTSTTYDSWLYTLSLGGDSTRSEYAAGTFHAVDPDGRPVDFGTSLLGTFTSAGGGLVTINTSGGGFTYTNTLPGAAFFHRATSENEADRYDTVNIPVTSADGVNYTLTFKIQIIDGSNSAPTASPTTGAADGLGVVRGSVGGSDSDGDTLTYSLVGSSVNGLSNNSAYTKNGAGNGGIVTLNATTGAFTYVSSATAGATQSFQVQMTDGHGGTTIATVTVANTTSITPGNLNTSTPYVVTGSVPVPSGDAGIFTSYALGASPTRGTVTSFNPITGAFTYTSSVGRTTANSDVVTVIATDAAGRTVTLKLAVNPSVVNSAPVGTGVTVGSSSLTRIFGPYDRQDTSGTLKATDAEGDSLTWAAGTYGTAQGGTITVSANGTFTYTNQKYAWFGVSDSYWHDHAVPGDPGDTVTIAVTDAFGATTNVTYGIPIEKQNAAPTLSGSVSSSSTSGLGVVRGTIASASDGDGDTLTYSLVNASGGSVYGSNGGIVTMSGTSFTYIPKSGVTSDTFQVRVDDGHGGVTTSTVTLSGLTTPSPQTNTNTSIGVVNGSLNVPGGDTGLGLTYSLGSGPSKGSVVVNSNGTYTYTRTAGLGHTTTPNDSFTIKATDASGKSVIIATINVNPTVTNAAPTPGTTTIGSSNLQDNRVLGIGNLNQTSTGTLHANDADGDTLTYTAGTFTTANGGTVIVNADGTFNYTISKGYSYYHAAAKVGATGTAVNDTFTATVSDAFGGSTSYTATVPIYAQNSAPGTTSGGTRWGNYWTGVGNASDSDSDDLTYVVTSTQGTATYDSFWLTLSTSGASSGTVVTITVYDGYYVVSGGAVTAALSSNSRTYTVA